MPRIPKLMGATEVADYLGIATSNIDAQVGMPKPVQVLACGRIWLAEDIRIFKRARDRRRRGR